MSITVSSQAQYMYDTYALTNSDTYKKNGIDSSTVSKEEYNVSNLTNALDALDKADSVNFSSIGNIDSYAKNAFKLSQLDSYDTLSDTSTTSISDLISGNSGSGDIYKIIENSNTLSTDEIQKLFGTDTSTSSQYSQYLIDSGNVINTLA